MKVSVVIPAYNEEERIEAVLNCVVEAKKRGLVWEIIVVDDGSEDNMAQKVEKYSSVNLVRLEENSGKANAMNCGVEQSNHPHILFLDADLEGLKIKHIEKMIEAYQEKERVMIIGVFYKGRFYTDFSQRFLSWFLSGQRILPKEFWNKLEVGKIKRYEAEMALRRLATKESMPIEKVKLEGLSHVLKEQKRGFLRGVKDRIRMYFDVTKIRFLSFFLK